MITLTSVSIGNAERLIKIRRNSQDIWEGDESSNPKVISSWNSGALSDRQISASGGTMPIEFEFQNPVDGVATSFEFNFDNGCTLSTNYTP
jgi:hypothetical protein